MLWQKALLRFDMDMMERVVRGIILDLSAREDEIAILKRKRR